MNQTKGEVIPKRELEALRQALADALCHDLNKALADKTISLTMTDSKNKTAGLSSQAKSLLALEKKLAAAINGKDRKTRGRIYNDLVNITHQGFLELLRLLNKNILLPHCYLAKTLVQSFVDHGKAKELFELLQDAIFNEAEDKIEGGRFLITTMQWLGFHQLFSASLIRVAMTNSELENLIKFMIFYCFKHGLKVKTTQPKCPYFPWLNGTAENEDERCFAWPSIPQHQEWMDKIIISIYDQWEKEEAYLHQVSQLQPDWGIIDRLWSTFETEANYGLHFDGDIINFKIPAMALFRITAVTLKKSEPIPCAEVIIHTDTFGVKQEIFGRLADGRLDFAESFWCEYIQWLITLAIVIGYHQIITGQEPDDDPWYTKCNLKKSNKPIERRAAKPHFYTLRPGHHASDDAKANCLHHLGRELAPGKTFRVGKKMVVCTKKMISTVVTQETILRHTANI